MPRPLSEIDFTADWGDPELPRKTAAFFLEAHAALRLSSIQRQADPEQAKPTPAPGWPTISLTCANLPDENLDAEEFACLFKANKLIADRLAEPMQETDDPIVAALDCTQRKLLIQAQDMILRLFYYVALDKSYHPEYTWRCNAESAFDYDTGSNRLFSHYQTLLSCATLCNLLVGVQPINLTFSRELQIFHSVSDIYYDILQTIFPIGAVAKCRRAMTLMLEAFGTRRACEQLPNFVRRTHTLFREIVRWRENGGRPGNGSLQHAQDTQTDRIESLQQQITGLSGDVNAAAAAVTNLARQQRNFLDKIKTSLNGFFRFFRPGAPANPTREAVQRALLPADRYDCLARINEPHRSQLKAVIDFTYERPIERDSVKRDAFTLAKAAEVVYRRESAKWDRSSGTFASLKHLQSACQHLRKNPQTDPFRYT